MEYSEEDRYTLIEQSPNYSNRTFNGIILVSPAIQLIQYVVIKTISISEMPSITGVSNCTVS